MKTETVIKILKDLCSEEWTEEFYDLRADVKGAINHYTRQQIANLPDMDESEKMLVLAEKNIDAIKAYRNRTGLSLSSAKEKVDEYSNQVYAKLYRPKFLGHFDD